MLKPIKNYRVYRLVSGPDRRMPKSTREANYEAGLHPRGSDFQVCLGDEFYDRDPAPADSERVPGKRYGFDWSLKRGYIRVDKDTAEFVPPAPPVPELPSWSYVRQFPFRGEGGGLHQVLQIVHNNKSALAGVAYLWGDESFELLEGLDNPAKWQRVHGLGGWARLRTAFAAIRSALA